MQLTMRLPGAMTVRAAAPFQRDLLAAFDAQPDVILDLSDVAEVDLSFVQTVHAARDHAARHGGQLRLAAPAQGAVRALLDRGGFTTDASPEDLDFWFHGELPR
ncbi:STAS domain-containing protein [Sphingomonas sp. CJ20]